MTPGKSSHRTRKLGGDALNCHVGHSVQKALDPKRARRALEAKRDELRGRLTTIDAVQVDRSADDIDQVISLRNADLAARTIDSDWRTRNAVEDALRRLNRGGYGTCEDCGRPIHPKRLEAIPWAALCFRCQDLHDQQAA